MGSGQQVTWTATHAGKPTRLEGGLVVEGNYLVLAGEDWTLIGNVTGLDESGFHFKLLEDDPTDPGLEFKRVGPPKPGK